MLYLLHAKKKTPPGISEVLLTTKCWVQAHFTSGSLDINADHRTRAVIQVEQKSVTGKKIDSSISANDIFKHAPYTA